MYYPVSSPELEVCLRSARYKFCNLTSFIRLRRKIKNINNISLKFIMWTDNNQIFKNCFVIIYCNLTKVSSQINKCIIFEPNELSITLSTLWCYWDFIAGNHREQSFVNFSYLYACRHSWFTLITIRYSKDQQYFL